MDNTYFLSFYRNGKRMGAMPIAQVILEKITVYEFQGKPHQLIGKAED